MIDAFFTHSIETDGVTVRAAPHFLEEQSAAEQERWFWSYHIRIENNAAASVQLLTRHWKITDGRGTVNHVDGDGVVGEQPLLNPGEAHDYVSGCPLTTPTGEMEGHYRFIRADGSTFLVEIPRFELLAPAHREMKRTHLPLNGLRVLDAAARHLSFTNAADELAVTPAAVGQQIRALEDMLGVVLFRRTSKGLELTGEAAAGLDALRSGFLQFEEAVRAMQAGQSSNSLTIAAPRDFTAKWLAARLAEYGKANPETRFTLVSTDGALDFTEANLDIAIQLADGSGEHEGTRLASGAFVTVAAPEGGADTPISWPGCPVDEGQAALRLSDAGLAIDAAANGLGRACVPHMLAEADLAAGRVRAVDNAQESEKAYWLIAPLPQWRQKKVKALVESLTGANL